MDKNEQLQLMNLIKMNITLEFQKCASGNLKNTMYITETPTGYELHIPAPRYNQKLFREKGVIKYTYRGSYASEVDIEGSSYWLNHKKYLTGNHKDYADIAVEKSINAFVKSKIPNAKVKY